ncbi:stress response translation initiation inhibitor YciH [Teredinibacter purpureus]|jgi:translation initiation factor 1 (eIF-1/SUI1)|uniref:stress response translation initiation inhibitor YciH n=1 Tax=Teredinibacter purpureus TaxID=2731756 RepID=UPI0005F81A76|nr:stress response translation initiation inhibitor YciH [Teredinibacter purpureus]
MKNSKLVYSTDTGRVKEETPAATISPTDGIIRIRRETKGRKGKGVTTLAGFPLDDKSLKVLAKTLKQHCGTGGTVKEGVIEIQGDYRERLQSYLTDKGYTVKFAGG